MTDEDMGRISSLKQQGKSAAAIAEMLCLPANTVKSYLRRHPGTEDARICPQCGKAVMQNRGRKAYTIIARRHGLSLDSIFAENA